MNTTAPANSTLSASDGPGPRSHDGGEAGKDGPARGDRSNDVAHDWFRRFAHRVSYVVGKPAAFFSALSVILGWAVVGPIFHYSDTWQLVINTGTTIVTFLMVFLIQSTQNRDANAIHLKLDELIRATHNARNGMLALEQLSDEQLGKLEKDFERLRGESRLTEPADAPDSAVSGRASRRRPRPS